MLLTLILCLNTVNATENTNNTQITNEISQNSNPTTTDQHNEISQNSNPTTTDQHNEINNIKKISANEINKENDDSIQTNQKSGDDEKTESQNTKIIDDTTYSNYFSASGDIINDKIKDGDIIDIKGDITNKNFNINKQITFTSTSNGKIINGTIKLTSGADNSVLSNLHIQNSQDRGIGFLLIGVKNVEIKNNYLDMNGYGAYGVAATHSSYLKIIKNTIRETPTSAGTSHVSILLGDCHYNTISENDIEVTIKKPYTFYVNLNGIYLSAYGSGVIEGGICNYNNITNNRIKGEDTVWCYTIQMMGNDNLAQNNTVLGGSIGISSAGARNKIIDNNIQATEYGIAAGDNNEIIGNQIELTDGATGISTHASNCIIQNNYIKTTNKPGIHLEDGSNNIIKANTIETTTGNGIYIKGGPKNNEIIGNKINTQTIGILFKKQSKKVYPSNTKVKNNEIETTAQYTIDAYESGDTEFSNNDLTSSLGKGTNTIRFGSSSGGGSTQPISNKTYTLNDASYSTYFNDDGTLKKDKIGLKDTLNLNGPLYNKNLIIDVPITINGNTESVIYNGTITILADGQETIISNVNIINDNQIGIIAYETEMVTIENNIIRVNQIDESYGIYLHSSNYNIIRNNVIYSYGDYVNFGIFLYASDNNKVLKNKVNTISNDKPIGYQTSVMLNEHIDQIPQIFTTYGILAVYSSNNQINENNVNLTSLFKEPQKVTENCSNSMVGIDIYYRSHGNTVNNNIVNVIGNNPYSYGVGVLGSDSNTLDITLEDAKKNKFENNIITTHGSYFATGIIIGLGSTETIIRNNTVKASSNDYTYGITLEASQKSTITGNKLNLNSPAIYGIELYHSNKNIINKNGINVTGYYKYAITGYSASQNEIINNTMQLTTNNIKFEINKAQHSEVIPLGDADILLMKNSNNNLIKYNEIKTDNEHTINISSSENNVVTENLLLNKNKIGTKSIISDSNNQIENNGAYKLSVETDDIGLSAKAGETISLTAKVSSNSGNIDGATVTFYVGLNEVGTSPVQNGIAKINYKIPNTQPKGYLDIKFIAKKEDYINGIKLLPSMTTGLEITDTNKEYNLNINMDDMTAIIGNTVTFKATVSSTSGNTDGLEVKFQIGETIIGTVPVTNGIAQLSYNIPSNLNAGTYNIKAIVSGDNYISADVTKILTLSKKEEETTQTPNAPKKIENTNKVTLTTAKTTTTVSKNAKKLVLSTTLKLGKKVGKGKTVTYIINGKKYKIKTDSKGVAKLTLKKSTLKKLLKKAKAGQKITYKINYGKKTVKKYIKFKK